MFKIGDKIRLHGRPPRPNEIGGNYGGLIVGDIVEVKGIGETYVNYIRPRNMGVGSGYISRFELMSDTPAKGDKVRVTFDGIMATNQIVEINDGQMLAFVGIDKPVSVTVTKKYKKFEPIKAGDTVNHIYRFKGRQVLMIDDYGAWVAVSNEAAYHYPLDKLVKV